MCRINFLFLFVNFCKMLDHTQNTIDDILDITGQCSVFIAHSFFKRYTFIHFHQVINEIEKRYPWKSTNNSFLIVSTAYRIMIEQFKKQTNQELVEWKDYEIEVNFLYNTIKFKEFEHDYHFEKWIKMRNEWDYIWYAIYSLFWI